MHKKNGLIVRKPSSKTVSDAICTLLSDNSLSRKLGTYGRNLAEKRFNWDKIVDLLENDLKTVSSS